MADEDFLPDPGRELREPTADGVVDGEGAIFFQQEDGHGCELFCDGGHAEIGEGIKWGMGGGVGDAGGITVDGFAVLLNREGDAGLRCWEGMEKRVQPGDEHRLAV